MFDFSEVRGEDERAALASPEETSTFNFHQDFVCIHALIYHLRTAHYCTHERKEKKNEQK
jgi:hypothetical protein